MLNIILAIKNQINLVDDDPRGNRVLCDGTVPSYNPMNYEPEQLLLTKPAEVPMVPLDNNEIVKPPKPEIPNTPSSLKLFVPQLTLL